MNWKILFPLSVGFYMGFAFLSLPPALDRLMSLYGVSYTVISFLLSAMLWTHAIMQMPAGLLTDRLGVKRALFTGLILIGTGNLMGASAPSYKLALIGRVITGIGMGLAFVTNMKLIALYAPKNRIGSFQAFSTAFFSTGSILAFILLPRIASNYWQWVYLLPGLGCVPLLLYLPRLDLGPSQAVINPLPVLGRIIRMPSAWILGLIHALGWGTVLTFGNWLPSVLAEVWGSTTTDSLAWSGALAMLISGLARLFGGFILMRFSPVLIVRGSVLILTIIFGLLYLISDPIIFLCLILSAIWFGSVNFGAVFHKASKAVSIDSNATIFGFINFLGNVGAILFIFLLGWIKDNFGSFEWGFAFLCASAMVSFALSRIIKE